jgi:hypothetical protein
MWIKFQYKYPQEFLDNLAKSMGFEWTPVIAKLNNKDEIEVKPMGKPSGKLFYIETKQKQN